MNYTGSSELYCSCGVYATARKCVELNELDCYYEAEWVLYNVMACTDLDAVHELY